MNNGKRRRVPFLWLLLCALFFDTFLATGFVPAAVSRSLPRLFHPLCKQPIATPSAVRLYAKKKFKRDYDALPSLMTFIDKGRGGPSAKGMGRSNGVEAALMLNDKKRQDDWKRDIKKQFPWVPSPVLDTCVNSMADAFATVAPSQLKAALKPGGLEKVRPKIEADLVQYLMETSPSTKDVIIPLKDDDKRALLTYVVNMGLDYILKDVKDVLADPHERLIALHIKKKQIQRYMSVWDLARYRFRYFPVQMLAITGLSSWMGYSFVFPVLLEQYKAMTVLATISAWCGASWKTIVSSGAAIKAAFMRLLGTIGIRQTRAGKWTWQALRR